MLKYTYKKPIRHRWASCWYC